jgi:hypothetical protein
VAFEKLCDKHIFHHFQSFQKYKITPRHEKVITEEMFSKGISIERVIILSFTATIDGCENDLIRLAGWIRNPSWCILKHSVLQLAFTSRYKVLAIADVM